jgi:hypothetical protein
MREAMLEMHGTQRLFDNGLDRLYLRMIGTMPKMVGSGLARMRLAVAVRAFGLLFVLTACGLLQGCDSALRPPDPAGDAKAQAAFIGWWHGSYQQRDGSTVQFLAEHRADGTLCIEFKEKKKDGTIEVSEESGKWHVKDGLLRVQKEWIGGEHLAADDRRGTFLYRIESYSQNEISYRFLLDPRLILVARRVDPNFTLPD